MAYLAHYVLCTFVCTYCTTTCCWRCHCFRSCSLSCSFSWLSAQVHSNMVMHFSGQITESFDREFRCLYADSQIIDCFHNPDEESLPYYPYPVTAPNMGLDFFPERSRNRERVLSSENSSSQSSCSMSSIKAAPGMTNTVYKVTQGHDKKETSNSHLSPERRGGALTPSLHNQTAQGTRGSPNGTNHSPVTEHASSGIGQSGGIEWSKSIPTEFRQPNVGGTTSKFQTDHV